MNRKVGPLPSLYCSLNVNSPFSPSTSKTLYEIIHRNAIVLTSFPALRECVHIHVALFVFVIMP